MTRSLVLAALIVSSGVVSAQPAAPSLLEPEDGGDRFIDGRLSWSAVEDADAYRLQVDTLGGGFGTDLVLDDTVAVSESDVSAVENFSPIPEGFYEWRAAALIGGVQGPWSEVWSFESRFPVAVEESPDQGTTLTVRPNPATVAASVALRLAAGARPVHIGVYDALGREVLVVHGGETQERSVFALDTSGWPVGVYAVRATVTSGAGGVASVSRRFTVAH